jgi:hypothetical protein
VSGVSRSKHIKRLITDIDRVDGSQQNTTKPEKQHPVREKMFYFVFQSHHNVNGGIANGKIRRSFPVKLAVPRNHAIAALKCNEKCDICFFLASISTSAESLAGVDDILSWWIFGSTPIAVAAADGSCGNNQDSAESSGALNASNVSGRNRSRLLSKIGGSMNQQDRCRMKKL